MATKTQKPKLSPPFSWFGGKIRMAAKILPLMPADPHTYVEPFGGSAAMLFARDPAPVEVYNDLDEGLVGFYRVVADPYLFPEFYERVKAMPHCRRLYEYYRDGWSAETNPIARAAQWFYVAKMSYAGLFGKSWGYSVTASSRGMANRCSTWMYALDNLPAVHTRFARVQIDNIDWRSCINKYDSGRTLFYLDPPYVPDTRRSGKYAHELTADDHKDLVDHLLAIKGQAVLSGYYTAIYKPLQAAGWRLRRFKVPCSAVPSTGKGTGQYRTECVWISNN